MIDRLRIYQGFHGRANIDAFIYQTHRGFALVLYSAKGFTTERDWASVHGRSYHETVTLAQAAAADLYPGTWDWVATQPSPEPESRFEPGDVVAVRVRGYRYICVVQPITSHPSYMVKAFWNHPKGPDDTTDFFMAHEMIPIRNPNRIKEPSLREAVLSEVARLTRM